MKVLFVCANKKTSQLLLEVVAVRIIIGVKLWIIVYEH
jgi:hypothetical protein